MSTYVTNRDGGKTDEQGHWHFVGNVWGGNTVNDSLAVAQNSPVGMSVLVGTGDVKIDYSDYAYTAWNDASSAVTISVADGSNPRIDRVVAYIDRGMTPSDATPNNPGMLKFKAVAGTPAGSPTAPTDSAVNTSVGASNPWCELAQVRVNAGVTTITNANITDKRTSVIAPANSVDTNAVKDGAISSVILDVKETTDVHSGTAIAANTWTDYVGNKTFTVSSANSIIEISIVASAQVGGGTSGNGGTRLVIDSGGTPIYRILGGGAGVGSSGNYVNPFSGISTVFITGLSAGSHTLKTQVLFSSAQNIYLRPASVAYEGYSTTIIERFK